MSRGYDSPQLYKEDTLVRIRREEAEINEIARRINRIIEENKLPVKRMQLLNDPEEEDDEECE